MERTHFFYLLAWFATCSFGPSAIADSWRFDPINSDRIETFGATKIVLTTDARKNQRYPDFILTIFRKGELRAKYRGIAFTKLFASPDKSLFVGLSNSGVPGTAIVIFDSQGNLLLEAKHKLARFSYCEESVSLQRKWFDDENTDLQFEIDKEYGGYKSISLRDCKGKRVDLMTTVMEAYKHSLPKTPNTP